MTVIAVPSGAVGAAAVLGVSALASGYVVSTDPVDLIGGTLGIALVGLVFLGLPMAGLTLAVTGVWVALVRFVSERG